MDAPERGALMFVRFIAVSLIGITVVEIALYLAVSEVHEPGIVNHPYHPPPIKIFPYLLRSVPALLGVVILIKAKSIAEWISDKLEL
jgi:hypothetical protein